MTAPVDIPGGIAGSVPVESPGGVTAGVPVAAVQRRTLRVLIATQVLGGVGVALGVAVGSLLAADVFGSPALAGLAQTSVVLGAAIAALPMSRLMAARGRRPGLAVGYVTGAVGAVTAVVAAAVGAPWLLLPGLLLFGASTAANLQARYAATDLADPHHRSRALATVVWATTVGAVAGPNLAAPAGAFARALGLPDLTGAFLCSAAVFLLAGAVLLALLRPDPLVLARTRAGRPGRAGAPRRAARTALRAIADSPAATLGLAAVALSHTVMVSVMVMTPVHMHAGGAELRVVGLVISVHVAGMYALSPVVGWLADHVGRVPVVLGGQVVLLAALLVAGTAPSRGSLQLGVGLFLLGLGWSCGLVAGSTLLAESVPDAIRPAVQGTADLVMGLCAAAGGALAGVVVALLGYAALAATAALLLVPVTLLLVRPDRRKTLVR